VFKKEKVYLRAKALFVTRLLVLLDKFKADYVSHLVAESIKEAVCELYPDNGNAKFNKVQKQYRESIIEEIKTKLLSLLS
jgi:hypothetical protein